MTGFWELAAMARKADIELAIEQARRKAVREGLTNPNSGR